MDTFADMKELKRVDPIWKRLRVDRLWAVLFIVYTVFYLGYAVWARYFGSSKDAGLLWIYLFNLLWWGNNAIGHVKNEKYWQRIGQRRQEAMSDAQPFLATSQPPKEVNDLTLPFTLRLRWHRSIVIAIGALALVPILLLAIFGILALRQHNQTSDVLSPLAVLAFSFIILGLILYMTYFRGMPSLIEINETGIRTRYIQQERFLRWDEVRVFASYGAQGTKKNGFVTTYEVSNEHTVVRWSQQMLANPLLFVDGMKEDWNWVIGRVNSIVAERTNLPLLNFSDPGQQRSVSSGRFATGRAVPVPQTPSHPLIPIAQDDPLVRRMQFNGEMGKVIAALVAIIVISFLLGLFGRLSNTGNQLTSFMPLDVANLLLAASIIFLILVVFLGLILYPTQRYWKRIASKRQEALRQPERFQVSVQQEMQNEQPAPATIRARLRKTFLFSLVFIENFVIWLLLTTVIFHWGQKNLLVTILGIIGISLIMSVALLPILGRSGGWRIELRPDGIATRYGTVDTYVSWNDARLFARYKVLRVGQKSSRVRLYEVASEHTIVRWQWPNVRLRTITLEPEMSQEEFERWLGQLQSYIMARTGLTLLDLDN